MQVHALAMGETTLQCDFCGTCGVSTKQILKSLMADTECHKCSQPLKTTNVPSGGAKKPFNWQPKVTMTNCPVCDEELSNDKPPVSCRCCGNAMCGDCVCRGSRFVPGYVGWEADVCESCGDVLEKENHLEVDTQGRLAAFACEVMKAENSIRSQTDEKWRCELITKQPTAAITSLMRQDDTSTAVRISGYVDGVEQELEWPENKDAFKKAFEKLWLPSTSAESKKGETLSFSVPVKLYTAKDPHEDAELMAFFLACYLKHKMGFDNVQCAFDPLHPDREDVRFCDACCLEQTSNKCEACGAELHEPIAWHFRIDPFLPAGTPVDSMIATLQYHYEEELRACKQLARIARDGHATYCNKSCGGSCAVQYTADTGAAAGNVVESISWEANNEKYTLALHDKYDEVTLRLEGDSGYCVKVETATLSRHKIVVNASADMKTIHRNNEAVEFLRARGLMKRAASGH